MSKDTTTRGDHNGRTFTRREWLTRRAIMSGAAPMLAKEAVSSTAIEHPEWDMDGEHKTMAEWEIAENNR